MKKENWEKSIWEHRSMIRFSLVFLAICAAINLCVAFKGNNIQIVCVSVLQIILLLFLALFLEV
jgi:membrane protein YdbS with pleckstrin-like domain